MNWLRQVLPLEREYRLRDQLARGAEREGQPVAVHVAGWKTASQWMRLLLTDSALLRAAGRRPVYVRGRSGDSGLRRELIQPSRLLTPVYASADEPLLAACSVHDLRIAVVVREPIDLARSWFRTNAFGHPENPDVRRRRELMAAAGPQIVDQFRALIAEEDFSEVLRIGSSWTERAAHDSSVHIVDFARLTGSRSEQLATVQPTLEHLGLPADRVSTERLLDRYARGRLARVERLLRPPAERKYGPPVTSANGSAASSLEPAPTDPMSGANKTLTDDVVRELLSERGCTQSIPILANPEVLE